MKANELRIGNLISHDRCDKFRIDEVRLTNEGYILRMYVHRNTLTSYADMKLDEAKPIPLTLELLKKCGFTKNEYDENVYNHGLGLDLVYAMGFEEKEPHWHYGHDYEHGDGTRPLWKAIDYLHELQNLFFALTGEELQINLNNYECNN